MSIKRVLSAGLALILAGGLAACGSGPSNDANGTTSADAATTENQSENKQNPATGQKKIKVGVIQLVEHPALDAARLGFEEGLKEAGYEEGKNLELDIKNAQGEQTNCQTIAGQFANQNLDLIFAIATPAAQAAANAISDKPIVVTAVTDPEDADLVDSNEKPGGNLTGTSDLSPIGEQVKLARKLVPDAKKFTILYTSSEANSELQARQAEELAKAEGFEVSVKSVSSSNEVQQVTEAAAADADILYIPTDNMLASSMPVITDVAVTAKVPVIGGEENQLLNGALATVGINYFDLGKQTAAMAVRIIEDGADPATMPIEYLENTTLAINFETAKAIGLDIPQDIIEQATPVPGPTGAGN